MKKKDNIKKILIESILVISIMALYIVYGIHFLPLLIFLIPVPFVVLGIRNGFYSNIISIILTLLIAEIILGNTAGASLIVVFGPLSIAINYCIKNRKNSKQTILISTISFLVPFVGLIVLEGKIANIDFIKQIEEVFNQTLTVQIDMFKEMGMTNHKILQAVNALEMAFTQIIVLIPSFLSIFSFLVAYINYFFTNIILKKIGYGFIVSQRFSRFKLPNNILLGVVVMFLTGFLFNWIGMEYSEALLVNLTFLVGVMFMVQGLAVLDFLLIKMKIKLVFRIILIVMNILFIPIGSLIVFVGLLDSIFDMRKLRRPKS